jgi:CheY-like chemotaxis protein
MEATSSPTLRILVVEDDPDDARTTFRALRRSGRWEPVHVRSGSEALEAAAASAYGACLVDYRLPDMSGVELCRRLRALGVASPLVILSSVQSDAIVERALSAGANDFLVKHLEYAERLDADLQRVLGDHGRR